MFGAFLRMPEVALPSSVADDFNHGLCISILIPAIYSNCMTNSQVHSRGGTTCPGCISTRRVNALRACLSLNRACTATRASLEIGFRLKPVSFICLPVSLTPHSTSQFTKSMSTPAETTTGPGSSLSFGCTPSNPSTTNCATGAGAISVVHVASDGMSLASNNSNAANENGSNLISDGVQRGPLIAPPLNWGPPTSLVSCNY